MLRLSNLSLGYGMQPVVGITQWCLPHGEHGLILGPSGSGKTTLLYAVAGLLSPQSGEIWLGDTCLTACSDRMRDAALARMIGVVHQRLHLVAALTVLENILLAQYAAGLPQDAVRACHWLERLGLAGMEHRTPNQLSQGQLQRVALVRAVINQPLLVLGDEPTSALDDAACAAVMELLLEVAAASGASLLVATHDARIQSYFQHVLRLGGAHA